MLHAAWVIPALPLAGFVVLLLVGRRLGDPGAGWLGTLTVAASFAVTVGVFAALLSRPDHDRTFTQTLFTWIPAGGFQVKAGLLVDPLSTTMALFVTGISSLIHLYSVGYMRGDERYHTFFVYLNLFVFSMLVLVLADSFLLTFLGWEGVGACSYFLISFWFERPTAATAAKKAFITNRVGDFGFMLAMFLLFGTIGSLNYLTVFQHVGALGSVTATTVVLLLLLGAAGKSAQLPLYVWLPDAMEGPTPVSTLIHAATMVTAGVYLMACVNPLIADAPSAATVIAVVGGLTALFAATIVCAQDDIKRVLAYSTISQLGYMFLAVGSGAYVAAVFHMVTHAFFKALLFLGAGSVIHGTHDTQDMQRMGGLRRFLPVTSATFIVGWLAIAGVPPFAGFWSKDEILVNAWDKSPFLWAIGLAGALLTAYYMSRQVFLVFFGRERWKETVEGEHEITPHESPWTMTGPLVVLAAGAAVGGALNLPLNHKTEFLAKWLHPVFGDRLHEVTASSGLKWVLFAVTLAAVVTGIGFAARVFLGQRARPGALEPDVLKHGWYIDDLYATLIATPGQMMSAWAAYVFDLKVIDGAVNGIGSLVRASGSRIREVQTGYVRNYALAIVVGTVVLLGYAISRVAT